MRHDPGPDGHSAEDDTASTHSGTTSADPPLPRCSVFIATSVDGFIARSDGSIDWLSMVELEGEDYGFGTFFGSIDTLVMGRSTYDVAMGFDEWPYGGKRCLVFTHRPTESKHGEEFVEGDPADLMIRLAREGARHVYVDGGDVVRQFSNAGLIDDLTLSVVPIVLGDGIRLFQHGGREHRLRFASVQSWPSGLVQLRYRCDRSAAVR